MKRTQSRNQIQTIRQELLPPKLRDLFFERAPDGSAAYARSRYKIAYGGRGSSKSWGFGTAAAILATHYPLRVLCVRELQNSIKESVHRLLSDRIGSLGLGSQFIVQQESIKSIKEWTLPDGKKKRSEFIFAGIKTDPRKIKSTEDIDLCLVEEAETVSESSWRQLIPTVRAKGSEIWICFNPREVKDPTYQRFVLRTPPRTRRVKINWDDNPWFPAELELERVYALQLIAEAKDDDERSQAQQDYDHVWNGDCQSHSNAAIFRRRVVVEEFDDPAQHLGVRMFYGADWGFANDPTTLIRFWVTDHTEAVRLPDGTTQTVDIQELWISHEAFGYRVENDEIPKLFDTVPGARDWPIKADCARPETISHVGNLGFNITGAEKWPGSLEDGIHHLKAFRKIHIHNRCKKIAEEARLYSYKVDRVTNEVLPIVVDKWNHGWDAVRYGLDGFIQRRGVEGLWGRLGE